MLAEGKEDLPCLRWSCGSGTDIGGSNENQDDCFIWEDVSRGLCVVGVLDGHGRDVGKVASTHGVRALQKHFSDRADELLRDPYRCLVEGMRGAHQQIKLAFREVLTAKGWEVTEADNFLMKRKKPTSAWQCVHGGSSCSLVAIVGSRLFVANIGDSNAILCSPPRSQALPRRLLTHVGDAALQDEEELAVCRGPDWEAERRKEEKADDSRCLVLTAEHSPESPYEYKRLKLFRASRFDPSRPALLVVYDGSSHDKSQCNPVFVLDGRGEPVLTNKGTYYKNVRKEWASLVAVPPTGRFQDALAFTRSMGDFHLQLYGVSHLPEVQCLDLATVLSDGQTLGLVVATDGVWDNYLYEDVASIVMSDKILSNATSGGSAAWNTASQTAADALIRANAIQASKNFGDQADNATCVVVYLQAK